MIKSLIDRVADQRGLMTTADVAEYLGMSPRDIGLRRQLGLGPEPVKIGQANYYSFEATPEWRALWFDAPRNGERDAGEYRERPIPSLLLDIGSPSFAAFTRFAHKQVQSLVSERRLSRDLEGAEGEEVEGQEVWALFQEGKVEVAPTATLHRLWQLVHASGCQIGAKGREDVRQRTVEEKEAVTAERLSDDIRWRNAIEWVLAEPHTAIRIAKLSSKAQPDRCLDIVRRVVLQGMTYKATGLLCDPPLSRERVRQIVARFSNRALKASQQRQPATAPSAA